MTEVLAQFAVATDSKVDAEYGPAPVIKGENINGTLVVPYGNETRKIRFAVVRYCNGLGLDLGCGAEKIVHTAIGIDAREGVRNLAMDFSDLRIFASNVFDFIYSSHAIEDMYYKEPVLKEWWRVLKPNGYLVLAWPDWPQYDASGEDNVDHKQKIDRRQMKRILESFAHAEIVKEEVVDRSSVLVLKKLSSNAKGHLIKPQVRHL